MADYILNLGKRQGKKEKEKGKGSIKSQNSYQLRHGLVRKSK